MRWVGHLVHRGERQVHTGFWKGDLREEKRLGDPRIDERTILKWIFKKWDAGAWTGLSWLSIGTGCGLL
jgi:hypothetical protein